MASEIKVDTISEKTSANGVTIDGVSLKDSKIATANSVDSDAYVDGSIDAVHLSANSVDSDAYVDGSIDAVHLSANSVDSDAYVDASIDTAHIGATQVTGAKLNTDVISAQTALTAEPADTDEFMVSDAGVLKRIDYSLIKGGGKVLQVVTSLVTGKATSTDTDYAVMHTSSAITCSATSSTVLVMITTSFGNDVSAGSGSNANFRFARAIDGGTATLIFADPMYNVYGKVAGDGVYYSDLATVMGIDSPSSTGALTYSIAGRRIDGSAIPFIGGRGTDASYAWGTRFILMEIGA